MLVQQEIAFAKNQERIGSRLTCLVEEAAPRPQGRGPRQSASRRPQAAPGLGRFYGQAPEIDGLCLIRYGSTEPGRFVETRVVGTQDYDLVVEEIRY